MAFKYDPKKYNSYVLCGSIEFFYFMLVGLAFVDNGDFITYGFPIAVYGAFFGYGIGGVLLRRRGEIMLSTIEMFVQATGLGSCIISFALAAKQGVPLLQEMLPTLNSKGLESLLDPSVAELIVGFILTISWGLLAVAVASKIVSWLTKIDEKHFVKDDDPTMSMPAPTITLPDLADLDLTPIRIAIENLTRGINDEGRKINTALEATAVEIIALNAHLGAAKERAAELPSELNRALEITRGYGKLISVIKEFLPSSSTPAGSPPTASSSSPGASSIRFDTSGGD